MGTPDSEVKDKVMEIGGGMFLRKNGRAKYAIEFLDGGFEEISSYQAANLVMQSRIVIAIKEIEHRIKKRLD